MRLYITLLVGVAFLGKPQYKSFSLLFSKSIVVYLDFLFFQHCIVQMIQKVSQALFVGRRAFVKLLFNFFLELFIVFFLFFVICNLFDLLNLLVLLRSSLEPFFRVETLTNEVCQSNRVVEMWPCFSFVFVSFVINVAYVSFCDCLELVVFIINEFTRTFEAIDSCIN